MAERGQAGAVADPIAGSPVYPAGSRVNERGHLEIGGCDVVELAAEFGTPAYVYAEDDMRARARAYGRGVRRAHRQTSRSSTPARPSPARPPTGSSPRRASPSTSPPAASSTWRCAPGFDPERIYMHGNNKTEAELELRWRAGVGHVILDSLDEIERLERLARRAPQQVLMRVTPGIRPDTHDKIATGQQDSKFGFPLEDAAARRSSAARPPGSRSGGLHAHLGSQIFELDVYDALAEVLTAAGEYPVVNIGGGFGIAYTRDQTTRRRPAAYAEAMLERLPDPDRGPLRAGPLAGRQRRASPLYTVGTVKEMPGVRTYVAVDGGMSDNIRPMLYGAVYEAEIADRVGDSTPCRLVGHALRVRRRPDRARRGSRTRASATSSSPRRPAPTATRWRATTTASPARR